MSFYQSLPSRDWIIVMSVEFVNNEEKSRLKWSLHSYMMIKFI